jgi:hypothetical protein
MGVDVAGDGPDESVIVIRKGDDWRSYPIVRMSKSGDHVDLENKIVELYHQHRVDLVRVDSTGVGAGIAAHLIRVHGLNAIGIEFGGRSNSFDVRCANTRAEAWSCIRALLSTALLPPNKDMRAQLIGPMYSHNMRGEIQLEKKSDMRRRGIKSPDIGDAMALAALPTHGLQARGFEGGRGDHLVQSEWNPFSDEALNGGPLPESKRRYYAPASDGWAEWSKLKPEFE